MACRYVKGLRCFLEVSYRKTIGFAKSDFSMLFLEILITVMQ